MNVSNQVSNQKEKKKKIEKKRVDLPKFSTIYKRKQKKIRENELHDFFLQFIRT